MSQLHELLGDALERMKDELRQELLAELRCDQQAESWPRWMSLETLCRYTDSTPDRIRKLIARGKIPHCQEAPGCRLSFDRHEIDAWMTTYRHHQRR